MFKCNICGEKATSINRCNEHYRCDDCGTKTGLCTYTDGVLCEACHKIRVQKRIDNFDEDTEYTDEIICPWCGYVGVDSWDINSDEGTLCCSDCGKDFKYERNIEVTYSTRKV